MDKEQLIKEWFELEEKYRLFVLRVFQNGSGKHAAEPYSDSAFYPLWDKPKDAGWIEEIGSFKFKVSDKFLNFLSMSKEETGISDVDSWLKYAAPKKVTKEMAETVVNLICSQLNDNARGLILYRLDRSSVTADCWTVVPPPIGLQVLVIDPSYQEIRYKKIYEEDLTKLWEHSGVGWRYDLDWIYDKYQEIVEARSKIQEYLLVKDYAGMDDQVQHKAPDYLVDAVLKTYFELESKSDMNIYNLKINFNIP